MRTKYYAVVGNRDHIKINGEKRPFWEFLDVLPDGWLTSLAYHRDDVPTTRPQIRDCGAWSYKDADVPPVTPEQAFEAYAGAPRGTMAVAPDHMLIPGTNLDARRAFNMASARAFFDLARYSHLEPMACVHGMDLPERLDHARALLDIGYAALAVGGVAARASQRRQVTEMVEALRAECDRRSGGVWLHVLGLSSPQYVEAWSGLGVDSCDGASHFKQAFTGGAFFTQEGTRLTKHQAARRGEDGAPIEQVPDVRCNCKACRRLRAEGIDTRTYGSNEHNMGRAAHNLNMLLRAHRCIGAETVALVACASGKHASAAPARDLYRSPLFQKSRFWAEHEAERWYVLSALHGLLDPGELVAPYEASLVEAGAEARQAWGRRVAGDLLRRHEHPTRFVVLAGRAYRDVLIPILEAAGHVCEVPMAGLGIGQQLRWLTRNANGQLGLALV